MLQHSGLPDGQRAGLVKHHCANFRSPLHAVRPLQNQSVAITGMQTAPPPRPRTGHPALTLLGRCAEQGLRSPRKSQRRHMISVHPTLLSHHLRMASLRPDRSSHRQENQARALIRMPLDAAMPDPTMTAVGAARPTAQGQAITSTLMPAEHSRADVSVCSAGTTQATTRY